MSDARRQEILDLMDRHGIGYFDLETPGGRIVLDAERRNDHPPILAARVGLFLTRHPAEAGAPAWPRDVKRGEILGWLKTGPRLDPVRAEQDGIVRAPRHREGTIAGYGDWLF